MSPLKQPKSVAKGHTAVVSALFSLCLVLLGGSGAAALSAVEPGSLDPDSRLQAVAESADAGTVSPEVRDVQEAASGLEQTLAVTLEKLKELVAASEAAGRSSCMTSFKPQVARTSAWEPSSPTPGKS